MSLWQSVSSPASDPFLDGEKLARAAKTAEFLQVIWQCVSPRLRAEKLEF